MFRDGFASGRRGMGGGEGGVWVLVVRMGGEVGFDVVVELKQKPKRGISQLKAFDLHSKKERRRNPNSPSSEKPSP